MIRDEAGAWANALSLVSMSHGESGCHADDQYRYNTRREMKQVKWKSPFFSLRTNKDSVSARVGHLVGRTGQRSKTALSEIYIISGWNNV